MTFVSFLYRDLQEQLENKVTKVSRVFLELKVFQDLREIKEILGLKVLEVPREIEAKWVCQASRVSMVFMDYLDLRVQKVLQV